MYPPSQARTAEIHEVGFENARLVEERLAAQSRFEVMVVGFFLVELKLDGIFVTGIVNVFVGKNRGKVGKPSSGNQVKNRGTGQDEFPPFSHTLDRP